MIASTEAGAKTSITIASDFVQPQNIFWIFFVIKYKCI
jgi:hypothetical protein